MTCKNKPECFSGATQLFNLFLTLSLKQILNIVPQVWRGSKIKS